MSQNQVIQESIKEKLKYYIRNLKSSFFRLIRQVKKEFRLLRTDIPNLLIALFLPPAIIWLFAFMLAGAAETKTSIEVVVVSHDSTKYVDPDGYEEVTQWDNYTDLYLDAVEDSELVELIEFYNASEEEYAMETAREDLRDGKIKCIIVIPVEFTEFLLTDEPGIIECVLDSSNAIYIQDYLNAVQDSIKIFVEENDLDPEYVVQKYEEYSIPSNYDFRYNYNMMIMFPFMVFGISMVLTILVVVQEKPMARLLLTPTKKSEILISKFITYTIILAIQVAIILTSSIMNGLYLREGLLTVFNLYIALFTLGFAGITLGMFISTVSKTKTEANQLYFAFFIVILLLSGIFVPIDAMPEYLQAIAYILPLSHGQPMISGIISKSKAAIGFDFFCLFGLSVFLLLISFVIINRKRYEV
ncbi:MAG: ABC transporter permease [Promethearchaeota archaeon]